MYLKSWAKGICSWHRRAETAAPEVYLSGKGAANMIHMYRCVWLFGGDRFSRAVKGTCVTRQDETHDAPPASFLHLTSPNILLPPSATQKKHEGKHTLTHRHTGALHPLV